MLYRVFICYFKVHGKYLKSIALEYSGKNTTLAANFIIKKQLK